MKHKVSIIIPTYNCGQYLRATITSVLNQTYNDHEIIVVDDGSTDNTKEILSPYGNKIIYIFQENAGVSKARNTGIKNSKGEYIAFLDADDRWYPYKLEIQMQCFEKLPKVSLIFSDFSALSKNIITHKTYLTKAFNIFKEYKFKFADIFPNHDNFSDLTNDSMQVFWGNIFNVLFQGNFILPSTVLLKRECFNSVGLFNEDYHVAEDTDLFLRLSKHHEMAFIDKPLAQYKLPDDMNLTAKKNTYSLINNALKTQLQIIKDDPVFYKQNKKLIRKAIGKTYYRLSYFHISELDKKQARINSIKSINFNPQQFKAYSTFLFSFLPHNLLKFLGTIKHNTLLRQM